MAVQKILRITALSIDLVASIILTILVLRIHNKIEKAKSINEQVIQTIHSEKIITFFIIVAFIISFVLFLIAEIIDNN